MSEDPTVGVDTRTSNLLWLQAESEVPLMDRSGPEKVRQRYDQLVAEHTRLELIVAAMYDVGAGFGGHGDAEIRETARRLLAALDS